MLSLIDSAFLKDVSAWSVISSINNGLFEVVNGVLPLRILIAQFLCPQNASGLSLSSIFLCLPLCLLHTNTCIYTYMSCFRILPVLHKLKCCILQKSYSLCIHCALGLCHRICGSSPTDIPFCTHMLPLPARSLRLGILFLIPVCTCLHA